MKIKYLIAALACAACLFTIAQVADNPLREIVIQTNPTNYLAATSIRATFIDASFHPTTGKPLLTVGVEAWANEVEDGVTNRVLIRRQSIALTVAQLNAWVDSTNGMAFIKNALLNRTKLTEAP